MAITDLCSAALNTVRQYDMIGNGRRVLVGLSGGADSVALTHWLTKTFGKERVVAMHVNHMIRGANAERDERFSAGFAASLGIDFVSVKIDVPTAAGSSSLEETARDLRYAALEKEAEARNISVIALAHNANDNAETTIFNIARGCGISGIGIPAVRQWRSGVIVRPLIGVTRDVIEKYLTDNGLTHISDETNDDTEYTRNYIRHAVLPSLNRINTASVANISRLSAYASEDDAFITSLADKAISDGGGRLAVGILSALPTPVLKRAVRKAVTAVIGEAPSEKATEAVISLVLTGKNGTTCELPAGVRALIADGELFILNEREFKSLADGSRCGITLEKPIDENNVRVLVAKIKADTVGELFTRQRADGDSYVFGGLTRTLKKLKSDVPCDARQRRPVVCDKHGIVWYPGFRVRDDAYDPNGTQVYYTEPVILHRSDDD